MMNTTFFKKLAIVLIALFIVSCDKDYNTIGSDIIGDENFEFSKYTALTTKIYNQKTDAVETSNVAVNQLGIYKSSVFGDSKAGFVTQLEIGVNPGFVNPVATIVVDSVVLSVPYFSTKGTTASNGSSPYTLDQVYGTDVIDLKVYENGFFLRDFDIDNNSSTRQKFYSNEENSFSALKKGTPVILDNPSNPLTSSGVGTSNGGILNDYVNTNRPNQNNLFKADKREFVKTIVKDGNTTYERSAPRISLNLNKEYFQSRIINAQDKLINNGVFKDYFKGLYFQVQSSSLGSMYSLDLKKGNVTIYYKDKTSSIDAAITTKGLVLNMTGNSVNFIENTAPTSAYSNALTTANNVTGDQSIYLKGGQGSTAFIELFNAAELQTLRANKWLINDATLNFTIDRSKMIDTDEPQRIYVYNADTNQTLLDYSFDNSTNSTNPKLAKALFGGIITKDSNSKGVTYKIRITEHLNDIINENKENVRLGVSITNDINVIDYGFLKTKITTPKIFDRVPKSSIQTPLGTVLYGSNIPNTSLDYDKRLKLEIYYTKPN
jgi:hypothetical protein